ncbi:MAG: PQQ-binding-like beta-propeller repeat protein [Myxococcales bacterium]|nr:PQQ-binding-like beta-propeller repeat protein [Myxococcales bacterium]
MEDRLDRRQLPSVVALVRLGAVCLLTTAGCSSGAEEMASPSSTPSPNGEGSGAPTEGAASDEQQAGSESGNAAPMATMIPMGDPSGAASSQTEGPGAAAGGTMAGEQSGSNGPGNGPCPSGADCPEGEPAEDPSATQADAGAPNPATVARGDGSWSMMGQDPLGWYTNTAETTLSVDNVTSLTEQWRFTVAGFPPGSPVVAEGKVFVMATGGTYAIDLATGDEVWSRRDLAGTASVAYHEGSIYVHNRSSNLYKLDASDGTTQWGPEKSFDMRGCDGTSSPIVAGGKVFVGHSCGPLEVGLGSTQTSVRGGVEAHDAETGQKAWTYWTIPEPGENGAMVWSSVAVDPEDQVVFATTGNNYTVGGGNSDAIHAIDLESGERLWVQQTLSGDVWSMPSFEGGPDADFGANPIVADIGGQKVVAAGNKNADFWALDRETGEVLWSREGLSDSRNAANGGVLMNGAFDGRAFYAVSNDPDGGKAILHAFDASKDGEAVWPERSFEGMSWGAPSLANGILFVPVHTILYVLDAATGEILTMFDTGGTIAAGAAAVSDGKVIVASGLQFIYAPDAVNNNQIICYGL